MSIKRSNLSSVAFHTTAPSKSPLELSSAIADSALAETIDSGLGSLHSKTRRSSKSLNQEPTQQKSLLKGFPIRSGIGGIAGISLLLFGHGVLGLVAISYATLYGLSQFNSD